MFTCQQKVRWSGESYLSWFVNLALPTAPYPEILPTAPYPPQHQSSAFLSYSHLFFLRALYTVFFRLILMSFSNIIQMFECFMQKSVLFFPLLSFVSNTVFLLYLSLKKLLVPSHDMIFPSSIVLHMHIVIYSTV